MDYTVLMVDDEQGILTSLARSLDSEELTLLTTTSANEASRWLGNRRIDVLITDQQMPEMDGLTLCRQARAISPATYRMLLSGHMDQPQLATARQTGDIHRFVAKPWEPRLLLQAVREALGQSQLMRQLLGIKQSVDSGLPTFLTDRNWVIRLANRAMCDITGQPESDIIGRNLFSAAVSNMPVSLETELTRQVDSDQTWLGYFSLQTCQQSRLSLWASITAVSEEYCLCVFQQPDTITSLGEDQQEIERYTGEHQLYLLDSYVSQSDGIDCILIVRFDPTIVAEVDVSSLCFERLSQASQSRMPIFRPDHHIFLLPLADQSELVTCAEDLRQTIHNHFGSPLQTGAGALKLTPHMSCQRLAGERQDLMARIRQHLGLGDEASSAEARAANEPSQPEPDYSATIGDVRAKPVFDTAGGLIGLELLPEYLGDIEQCHRWLELMQSEWHLLFNRPMIIILRLQLLQGDQWRCARHCINQWGQQENATGVDWVVVMPWDLDEYSPLSQQNLRDLKAHVLLEMVVPDVNQRIPGFKTLMQLECDGFAMTPEVIAYWRHQSAAGQPVIRQLLEHGKSVFAYDIGSTEALAAAHQGGANLLAGEALSRPIGAQQLHWFAEDA